MGDAGLLEATLAVLAAPRACAQVGNAWRGITMVAAHRTTEHNPRWHVERLMLCRFGGVGIICDGPFEKHAN